MLRPVYRIGAGVLVLPLLIVLAGCSDDPTGIDDDGGLTAAAGFLGYSNVEQGRTVCGNCHLGKQIEWEQTAHAGAWSTLQAAPGQEATCQACHSVTDRGNVVDNPNVGFTATQNLRYTDVQCESCHGPGLNHATNPDAGAKPLAPLSVGANMTRGCGECHSGVHRPFAEEWQASRHSNLRQSQATNPSCMECHEGRAFLAKWGVDANYIEKGGPELLTTTCAVCHDPHSAANDGQLRFPIDIPDVDENLCMMCHHKRGGPDLARTTYAGPHSPEGPLLLGEGGWFPPGSGIQPGSIIMTHGNTDRNPRLCAGCHVNDYQVRDPLTNAFEFRATGHRFLATPCVDANGKPTGSNTCPNGPRSFQACHTCHSPQVEAAKASARARLNFLADNLQTLIVQLPAAETLHVQNRPFTTGLGARFNRDLARKTGSEVHNPLLVEMLLLATIKEMETDYGIRSNLSPGLLRPQLDGY